MTITTMESNEARAQWRTLIDATASGQADIVITRYGKPVSVMISYEEYLEIQEERDGTRLSQRSEGRVEETTSEDAAEKAWLQASAQIPPDPFTWLAAAADARDETRFVAVSRQIDWRRYNAPAFEEAIQLALAAGAHMAARHLAALGADLHPTSTTLKRAARVLAVPGPVQTQTAPDATIQANRAWLLANRSRYVGQWVALRNGTLLGYADSMKALTARFGVNAETLYTRVS